MEGVVALERDLVAGRCFRRYPLFVDAVRASVDISGGRLDNIPEPNDQAWHTQLRAGLKCFSLPTDHSVVVAVCRVVQQQEVFYGMAQGAKGFCEAQQSFCPLKLDGKTEVESQRMLDQTILSLWDSAALQWKQKLREGTPDARELNSKESLEAELLFLGIPTVNWQRFLDSNAALSQCLAGSRIKQRLDRLRAYLTDVGRRSPWYNEVESLSLSSALQQYQALARAGAQVAQVVREPVQFEDLTPVLEDPVVAYVKAALGMNVSEGASDQAKIECILKKMLMFAEIQAYATEQAARAKERATQLFAKACENREANRKWFPVKDSVVWTVECAQIYGDPRTEELVMKPTQTEYKKASISKKKKR